MKTEISRTRACIHPLFLCAGCRKETNLPVCNHCGYIVESKAGIYQLTDDPNVAVSDDENEASYIGYDEVGEYYGGMDWMECAPPELAVADYIASITGDGVFLDLGCGAGLFSIPAAMRGTTVIAGDISQRMLELLLCKAKHHRVGLETATVCRMNALDVPLGNESVSTVVVNSVLHLISKPSVVLREIYRVLQPGGSLLLLGNSPALPKEAADRLEERNREFSNSVNTFYAKYWEELGKKGLMPTKHSWKFDQHEASRELFGNVEIVELHCNEVKEYDFESGFLFRLRGKGFSDQQFIDDASHAEAFENTVNHISRTYGDGFFTCTSVVERRGIGLRRYRKES